MNSSTALARRVIQIACAMRSTAGRIGAIVSLIGFCGGSYADDAFEKHVRPLLVSKCLSCHSGQKSESGLQLNSLANATRGGDSGAAIVPGNPNDSLFVKAIRHEDGLAMPPEEKLSDETIAAVEQWIQSGATWPEDLQAKSSGPSLRSGPIQLTEREHWAYQSVKENEPPEVDQPAWNRNAIDQFVYDKLSDNGLAPRPKADRRTLVRRASFDLTGLPPTVDEVEAFVQDESPDAYARLIERLLNSDAYGERWGRHWLDVVRYADTAGETADFPVPQAYKYRNWVIDAFNRDMPYDQFLREQLAGDRLAALEPNINEDQYRNLMIATGFLAISRRFGFNPEQEQHFTIQDTIDTVGQAVLGLTIGCARCHDHKYDPLTMQDYYGWYGIFNSTRYAFPGCEQKPRPYDLCADVPPSMVEELKKRHEERIAKAPEPEQVKLKAETPYGLIYGVVDREAAADVAIQLRGEPDRAGAIAARRNLEILGGQSLDGDQGSGRLAMARWLTADANPLTARVMVNRIWHYHFGRGLVSSTNDFGVRGGKPSHPELLDWLAIQFQRSGYSMKAMHRMIMNSQAYQQASDGALMDESRDQLRQSLESASIKDPENQLLWKFNRRRLSAEEIRDAMLMVSGNMDASRGGEHPFPAVESWSFTQHAPFYADYDTSKRSVYLMQQRLKKHPFLSLFDGADTNASTANRTNTTVPTQSLYLMNNSFVHRSGEAFAARIMSQPDDNQARIRWSYLAALGRQASEDEIESALRFIEQINQSQTKHAAAQVDAGWSAYARMLLVRNEFLFVE